MSDRIKLALALVTASLVAFGAGALTYAVSAGAAPSVSNVVGSPLAALKPSKTFPALGTDTFESLAEVSVQPGCSGPVRDLVLSGPTSVSRGTPAIVSNHHTFSTQMQSLNLVGFDTQLGDVLVTLNLSSPTTGRVTANAVSPGPDFPATSFFDVFVEIQTSGGTLPAMQLHNNAPIHMQNNTILGLPPIGSEYGSSGTPVQLFNPSNAVVACVIHSSHVPEDPSHILLEHQLLLLEKKLNTIAPGP